MSSSSRVTTAACLLGAGLFLSLPNVPEQPADPSTGPAYLVTHSASVTPDEATGDGRAANSGGHILTFTVTNTGGEPDTYDVTCAGVAKVACTACSPTRLSLDAGQSASVDVSFEVFDAGAGLLSLTVFSPITRTLDRGSYRIPVAR